MFRPVAISLSPNAEKDDILLALKHLFYPFNFIKGKSIKSLEQWFRNNFKSTSAVSFDSGRASLYAILKGLRIEKGDEVIIQPFTCVALPNAITSIGAKPIYADIEEENFSFNIKDLEKKISEKTKAIIVQHTFGIPQNIKKIVEIAKKHKLFVVEDCAHIINTAWENKLGTFGEAAFFSFGRDKAFSSVCGGMAITNNAELGEKIKNFQKEREFPSFFWTFQQIFHPVAFSLILPLYNFFSLGKVMLVILQKLHLLSMPVSNNEKKGKYLSLSIKRMPNSLADMAYNQLKKHYKFNKKREEISAIYIKEFHDSNLIISYSKKIPFLRFPCLVDGRDEILKRFRKKGIYLGKWYSEIIDPKGSDLNKAYYKKGSCPKAEEIAERILNLPCYPTMRAKDARKIVLLLNKYANQRNKK